MAAQQALSLPMALQIWFLCSNALELVANHCSSVWQCRGGISSYCILLWVHVNKPYGVVCYFFFFPAKNVFERPAKIKRFDFVLLLLPADEAETLLVICLALICFGSGSDKSSPLSQFAQVVFPIWLVGFCLSALIVNRCTIELGEECLRTRRRKPP